MKHEKNISGIYEIININNDKKYVGSATNLKSRWNIHKHRLRKGNHPNCPLQLAWNKYGEESFSFNIDLIKKEQELIDEYLSSAHPLYNIRIKAESNLGFRHSEESKKKMSESRKGEKSHCWGKKRPKELKLLWEENLIIKGFL